MQLSPISSCNDFIACQWYTTYWLSFGYRTITFLIDLIILRYLCLSPCFYETLLTSQSFKDWSKGKWNRGEDLAALKPVFWISLLHWVDFTHGSVPEQTSQCDEIIIIYVLTGIFIILENRQFSLFTKHRNWIPVGIIALLIMPFFVHILLRQRTPFPSGEFICMNCDVSGLTFL